MLKWGCRRIGAAAPVSFIIAARNFVTFGIALYSPDAFPERIRQTNPRPDKSRVGILFACKPAILHVGKVFLPGLSPAAHVSSGHVLRHDLSHARLRSGLAAAGRLPEHTDKPASCAMMPLPDR